MPSIVKVFLDTSALFAGIWSSEGGGRMILKLGGADVIEVLVSPQVLAEVERALRRKAPHLLGLLTLLLDSAEVEVVDSPSPEAIENCYALTGHAGDAQVLAAAQTTQVDYFVTLDRKHFLDNQRLQDAITFLIGTPGDFLAWYREQLGS